MASISSCARRSARRWTTCASDRALEVSSPGLDRRLRKPAHFAAALGRDVAVKLAAPRDGRTNFRGVLEAADATSVTLDLADGGSATLPLAAIAKAHVVYNFDTDGGHRE